MKDYKYILFDFDGTIIDTGKGIMNSIRFALNSLSYKYKDQKFLKKFIGPPLTESFSKFCLFDEEKTNKAIKLYRDNYKEKGMFDNENYDGIQNLLEDLKKSDKKIILATSKPEYFAKKILEKENLLSYFDFIAGSTLDGKRNSKIEVLEYAIDSMQIKSLKQAIMIGDRKFDILGARNFNIDSIGVLYGYGTIDELNIAGATYIAKDVKELKSILL